MTFQSSSRGRFLPAVFLSLALLTAAILLAGSVSLFDMTPRRSPAWSAPALKTLIVEAPTSVLPAQTRVA
jgi:hypothetical protein